MGIPSYAELGLGLERASRQWRDRLTHNAEGGCGLRRGFYDAGNAKNTDWKGDLDTSRDRRADHQML